jgi:aconitase A
MQPGSNPVVPAELVVDHSVIADVFGTSDASARNVEIEYGRNAERYRHGHPAPAVPRGRERRGARPDRQETYTIDGLGAGGDGPYPSSLTVHADNGAFPVTLRLDTPHEHAYIRHGGIMKYVLRAMAQQSQTKAAGPGICPGQRL